MSGRERRRRPLALALVVAVVVMVGTSTQAVAEASADGSRPFEPPSAPPSMTPNATSPADDGDIVLPTRPVSPVPGPPSTTTPSPAPSTVEPSPSSSSPSPSSSSPPTQTPPPTMTTSPSPDSPVPTTPTSRSPAPPPPPPSSTPSPMPPPPSPPRTMAPPTTPVTTTTPQTTSRPILLTSKSPPPITSTAPQPPSTSTASPSATSTTTSPPSTTSAPVTAMPTSTPTPPLSTVHGGSTSGSNDAARDDTTRGGPATIVAPVATSSRAPLTVVAVYSGVTLAALSLVLQLGFQHFAAEAPLGWTSGALSVNTWELPLYTTYLQQLAGLSVLAAPRMPRSLADFTDALSWSNFVLQRTGLITHEGDRRLMTAAAIADERGAGGVHAYVRRIGLRADDRLLPAILLVVAVIYALLGLVGLGFMLCGRPETDQKFHADDGALLPSTRFVRGRHHRTRLVGIGVLVWLLALYPLSLGASFQLHVEYHDRSSPRAAYVVLGLGVLMVMCVLPLGAMAVGLCRKMPAELREAPTLSRWGVLYAHHTDAYRVFFVVAALVRIVVGICVGAQAEDGTTQLTAVVIVLGIYVFLVGLCRPFVSRTAVVFAVGVAMLEIINVGLTFAFVSSSERLSRARLEHFARVILVLNVLVLVAWFLRHVIMLQALVLSYLNLRDETELTTVRGGEHSVGGGGGGGRASTKDDRVSHTAYGGQHYVTMMMSPTVTPNGGERQPSQAAVIERRAPRLAMV